MDRVSEFRTPIFLIENVYHDLPELSPMQVQGWIQTSATSFQKLVRIVKKLKKKIKKNRKPCQKVPTARCQFLPGVQLQNLLIATALHLLPACSGPAPWVSLNLVLTLPPPPPVDLCLICALVQIFYCFLCTSQNSLSLAEHNCAPVKVSFHWLLRFSALVVNYSIWVVFQRNLFVERNIVYWLISLPWYRVHLLVYRRRKDLVYWKRLEARSTVRDPYVDRNLWKAAKVSTEPSRKLNNPECFSAMADEATDVSNKEIKP